MDKWEYKVLFHLSEEDLNKWGEEGYEIDRIIPHPPTGVNPARADIRAMDTTVVLKRRKP